MELKYFEALAPMMGVENYCTTGWSDPDRDYLGSIDLLEKAASGGDVEQVKKQLAGLPETVRLSTTVNSDGLTALLLAVDRDHVVAIQTLVLAGADMNIPERAKKGSGRTPFIFAIALNRLDCARELMQLGADVSCKDASGRNALMTAAGVGQEDCLRFLLEAGAEVNHQSNVSLGKKSRFGETALMCAAENLRVNCLKLLLEAGADVNVKTSAGKTALLLCLKPKGFKSYITHINYSDVVECVKLLIKAGADVKVKTPRGKTPLILTTKSPFKFVYEQHQDVVNCTRVLLEAGVDVNESCRSGTTALMYAAGVSKELLSLLVKAGAVIDHRDWRGMTALANAAKTQSEECIRYLLDCGASVNICDTQGQSPLHHFIAIDQHTHITFQSVNDSPVTLELLEIFLSKHADVNAKNYLGKTPLMLMAARPVSSKAMAMLLENGAEINVVDKRGQSALSHSFVTEFRHPHPKRHSVRYDPTNANFLLDQGAKPIGSLDGKSLLSWTARFGHTELVKRLAVHEDLLSVEWDDFVSVVETDKKKRLQTLIINGVVPTEPAPKWEFDGDKYQISEDYVPSILETARQRRHFGISAYLIAVCYICREDLTPSTTKRQSPWDTNSKIEQYRSQPWPLVKLCFAAVSTAFGASPGRKKRIKNSQLPPKLQNMLLFQEPWSRLCVHQWDKIPLTFCWEKYEKLPQPRPLLYHWPVGRALVPCNCGRCGGTNYKYEEEEEEEEGDS